MNPIRPIVCAAFVSLSVAGTRALEQEPRKELPPIQREEQEQRRTRDADALREAERNARELRQVADALVELARDAREVADTARARADAAEKRLADLRRRRDTKPTPIIRRGDGVGERSGAASSTAVDMEDLRERVLAAATRSAEQNKAAFLPPVRASRAGGPPRKRVVKTFTFPPGEAPDMADIDLFAEWQWGINVARGGATFAGIDLDSIAKTGNVDVARVSIQPDPASDFAPQKMKWGMRRYNLGDTTVTDCDFSGIPEEHGIYDNLSGHGLYRGNTFLNLGGQAIQIAHRDAPYQQYKADNIRLKASPLVVYENNHAVDCGRNAARSGFTWTFFDAGSCEHPSTIVLRGCTAVAAWDFTRTAGGETVEADHPGAIRSPGGLMVHHYKPRPEGATNFPTEHLVLDACLFDLTKGQNAIAAARGVGEFLIKDSVFIARDHGFPYVDVDDLDGHPSGTIVLQNCVSPENARVWLRIRRENVMPMHCPGRRVEIDVATRKVTETPLQDDPITRIESPLAGRVVKSGMNPQPPGHVDDLGEY